MLFMQGGKNKMVKGTFGLGIKGEEITRKDIQKQLNALVKRKKILVRNKEFTLERKEYFEQITSIVIPPTTKYF